MELRLEELDPGADAAALADFLSVQRWPFHLNSLVSKEAVLERVNQGYYRNEERRTFWIVADQRVGIAVLEDLQDDTPLFDLRLAEVARGCGYGRQALALLTEFVFSNYPSVRRFEGQTREDNQAMRRVFLANGFVQEARYREGWPVLAGPVQQSNSAAEPRVVEYLDSIGYAMLRRDFEAGTSTPVKWAD